MMNSTHTRFLNLRTVGYTIIMLVTVAVILHVVLRDLLGYIPDFDLTSAVVLTMLGGLVIITPFLLFDSNGFARLSPYPESEKKDFLPDLKSIYITIVLLLGMGILLAWSGIMPLFDLDSVVYTLTGGALAMTVSSLSRRRRKSPDATSGDMRHSS